MNDNKRRGMQWRPLIAEYFSPRFGGEKENWMDANTFAMGFVMNYLNDIMENNLHVSHKEYKKNEDRIWTEKMFEFMSITPPDQENYSKLAQDVYDWIVPQVKSFYPGIIECIRTLSKSYILNTASNADSRMLNDYLVGMEVRECFQYIFGTDLIDIMKGNESYYHRIFSFTKINPEKAVVIDDKPNMLHQAQKTKVKVIQSCLDGQTPEYDYYFTKPEDLPELIKKLG